jgi:hypothetical protein
VGDETSDFVSHSLGRNDGHFSNELLVDVEVKGEARVVLLDDHTSGFLDGLGTNTLKKKEPQQIKSRRRGHSYASTNHFVKSSSSLTQ